MGEASRLPAVRWLTTLVVLGLVACGQRREDPQVAAGVSALANGVRAAAGDESEGLRFRLEPGPGHTPGATEARPPVETAPLPEETVEKILGRLPALPERPGDQTPFRLPAESPPAPRPGETTTTPFPPKAGGSEAPDVEAGPLRVARFQPEGYVPVAAHVSLTFSKPMVPLTSHKDLGGIEVPVRLDPEPKGRWEWVGTRTLVFRPEGERMPMATSYTVSVPKGVKSSDGSTLEDDVVFRFMTPAVGVETWIPSGRSQPLRPVSVVVFDQAVDADAILASISLELKGLLGTTKVPIRKATAEEIAGDDQASRLVKSALAARYVAFVPQGALPKDQEVRLVLAAGAPSAEGPLRTTKDQTSSFRTFGPFQVQRDRNTRGRLPQPGESWWIEMSNPIDEQAFDPDAVRIDPEIPGIRIEAQGRYLRFYGRSKGRRSYEVTLPKSMRDTFGQSLGEDVTRTWRTQGASPALGFAGDSFVVLDPKARPTLPVFVMNHEELRVRIYRVGPAHWSAWLEHLRDANSRDASPTPPGDRVFDEKVETGAEEDDLHMLALDLAPAFDDGHHHAIVVVEPVKATGDRWRNRPIRLWVQRTGLGVSALADGETLLAWVTSLTDGRPIEGAEVRLDPMGRKAKTGPDGLARIPLESVAPQNEMVLTSTHGGDTAMLPATTSPWGGPAWSAQTKHDRLVWYVADDRRLYRPGEEARIKGWIRQHGGGPEGVLGPLGETWREVLWEVHGARGNKLAEGKVEIGSAGDFDLGFTLPEDANLGWARIKLTAVGGGAAGSVRWHGIQVQEFRRPEFEVQLEKDPGPHVVGGSADVSVEASYYAGGGLAGAPVQWNAHSSEASFTPPGQDDFTFGTWRPWWSYWGGSGSSRYEALSGTTDGAGRHGARVVFESVRPARPSTVTISATVRDENQQAWSASQAILVHPSKHYVGLRTKRTFIEAGKKLPVEAIVCDLDGKLLAQRPISLEVFRIEWTRKKGQWVEEEVDRQTARLASAASGSVSWDFAPEQGGTYKVRARTVDAEDRPNETELTLWVAGGERPKVDRVGAEEVTLVPDKRTYAPGDEAELLVQAPFHPAEGILSIERQGLLEVKRFRMESSSHVLHVPITELHYPKAEVAVYLVGSQVRDVEGKVDELPRRPAYAVGRISLDVPPVARTLDVKVTPAANEIAPGAETSVRVEVRGADGAPVQGAQVLVVAVDEAVLSLTGYRLPDPIQAFYSPLGGGVGSRFLHSYVNLARPEDLLAQGGPGGGEMADGAAATGGAMPPAPAAARQRGAVMKLGLAQTEEAEAPEEAARNAHSKEEGSTEGEGQQIAMRADLRALALFAPRVETAVDGTARVALKLPDSLTRYRISAVAVSGSDRYGKSESTLTARLPLMVRPSAPRFLRFGDRFVLPVTVQNQTDEAMDVDVAARASNLWLFTSGDKTSRVAGQRVRVPARDRVVVGIEGTADLPGTARVQVAAVSEGLADAQTVSLPVYSPATTEAFATYGEIDEGARVYEVRAPSDAVTSFGGLTVSTASTQLQALTDAFIYLVDYPFECAEQISSRMLATAALRDVMAAFAVEGLPAPAVLEKQMASDMQELERRQNRDGGFGFWRRNEESWPYLTVHVAHALARAEQKGYEVPDALKKRILEYLREIRRRFPRPYPETVRWSIEAYAIYVRAQLGDVDGRGAKNLFDEAGMNGLSLEGQAWLLPTLDGAGEKDAVQKILRNFGNRVEETAGAAHFTTSYSDGAHFILHSDRRADGIILDALLQVTPKSDVIPKVVRGLLAHKTKGRWGNTQENAFVLLALDGYFRRYEKETPDMVARAWLGDRFAGEQTYKGRTTERQELTVPMALLTEMAKDGAPLTLQKEGKGRLYYRIGMRYAPQSLHLEPMERGFSVERVYEGADDPKDVTRDANGTWHVKAGARVKVTLRMVAPARRYHVALVDPLPAGLETLNPAFATTEPLPATDDAGQGRWGWWWRWYQHQNLRDDRAEAFTTYLPGGVYSYTYFTRATTRGSFIASPAKAEEMYAPETFGRSGTDRVVVE